MSLSLSLITTKKTGVKETPMWRKGWVDRIESSTGQEHRVSLCNACGLLWKRGWFCVHCECVYRKDLLEEGKKNKEEVKEEEMWIGCEYCDNFSHFECERKAEDSKTILGMDAYACPECRMKAVLACAAEEEGGDKGEEKEDVALPKFCDIKDTETAKKTLGEPRKTKTTNKGGGKSTKKTGMKTVGKRCIHQRPFLRTPRGAGNGSKKGVEKNVLGLLKTGAISPGVKKNRPTKRAMTLSARKGDEEEEEEEEEEKKTLTKTPPRKKGTKKKAAQKVSKKVSTPKKAKETSLAKKKHAIEQSLAALETPPKEKKSKAAAAALEEEDEFPIVDDFDDSDVFSMWSMKPTAPSTKTALALQRAKQFLADEHIPLDAIKKHDSSLLGGLEDVFGDRTLLAADHEAEGSRESGTKAATTAAVATVEATTAPIPIFDEMFPATGNRTQDKVLASAEMMLKSARECLEKAVDDHWALVKQHKDNDERNQLQDHKFLSMNTRKNTQSHAFKPILNAKMALQKISSLPTLKKSLGSSSIKAKNAIVERSKIKDTLRDILQTFGNGREILENLSKLGGFWTTLATEFLHEMNQAHVASASMMMASINPSESLSVQGGPFATDVKKYAAAAAVMKEGDKDKDTVNRDDDITIVSPLPLKITCPVLKRPKLYPTGGGGFISNGAGQMVPRMKTTSSKHDSLFPPVPEIFDSEMYEDGTQPKSVAAPDASWGSPLSEYFDMVVNEGEQPNVSGEDID